MSCNRRDYCAVVTDVVNRRRADPDNRRRGTTSSSSSSQAGRGEQRASVANSEEPRRDSDAREITPRRKSETAGRSPWEKENARRSTIGTTALPSGPLTPMLEEDSIKNPSLAGSMSIREAGTDSLVGTEEATSRGCCASLKACCR